MATDIQEQLKAAIELAQQGQRDGARMLLERVVQADPRQELAWLWLAVVSTSREERQRFLERTLALNPNNARALSAYAKLTGQPYQPPAASAAPETARAPEADLRPPAPEATLRPASVPRDWTETLEPKRSPVFTAALILVTLAVVAFGVFYFARQISDGDDDETPAQPTIDPNGQFAPGEDDGIDPALATQDTFQPVPLGPTDTPRPTITPGPSPTSIWDNPPATWTPVPSATPRPSRTPLPSFTPRPTLTPTSRALVERTPYPTTAAPDGPPTSTPLYSPTPSDITATPRYVLPTETPTEMPTADPGS